MQENNRAPHSATSLTFLATVNCKKWISFICKAISSQRGTRNEIHRRHAHTYFLLPPLGKKKKKWKDCLNYWIIFRRGMNFHIRQFLINFNQVFCCFLETIGSKTCQTTERCNIELWLWIHYQHVLGWKCDKTAIWLDTNEEWSKYTLRRCGSSAVIWILAAAFVWKKVQTYPSTKQSDHRCLTESNVASVTKCSNYMFTFTFMFFWASPYKLTLLNTWKVDLINTLSNF